MEHAAHASQSAESEPGGIFGPRAELRASIVAGVVLAAWFVLSRLSGLGVPGGLGAVGEACAWASLGIGLLYGGRAALEALRERKFDIDVLMVVAAVMAAALGHPEDGALLLFLFVLSGALEDRAMRRTMRAVEALHKLMPKVAMVWRGMGGEGMEARRHGGTEGGNGGGGGGSGGGWVEVEPMALEVGERIRVRSGELVPADARVTVGQTSVDQATLTGESLPREVGEGDEIYAGTLNVGHPIEAEVHKPASESGLQRVLDLVVSAQQQREPIQRMIDRLSQPYAIGVMSLSIAVFLIWWLVLKQPLLADGGGGGGALHTAIALLIVGSPCALVIATPTATLAAISRAARAGLLFKGGQAIERLSRMGSVVVDKTGTLTMGRPRLQQVHAVAWSDGEAMLGVAAGLEEGSTHPIAVAVVEASRRRGVAIKEAAELRDLPGKGLSGVVEGMEARLGTYEHCEPLIPVCLRARVAEVLERVRARGQIGVVVARARGTAEGVASEQGATPASDNTGQAAVLILSDTIRPGAGDMIRQLHELGVRPVRMLTGDNHVTAAYIAAQLQADQWDAELLPQDKVDILHRMREESRGTNGGRRNHGRRGVGAIGDGVNDAPVLAAADVSLAIGSIGSDAALESADIVLLNDDLIVIPWAVRLARRTRGIVVFNITLALAIIGGMGLAVLIGSLVGRNVPLPLAVVAHEGGTLLVVLNSLRLLMAKGPGLAVEEEPSSAQNCAELVRMQAPA